MQRWIGLVGAAWLGTACSLDGLTGGHHAPPSDAGSPSNPSRFDWVHDFGNDEDQSTLVTSAVRVASLPRGGVVFAASTRSSLNLGAGPLGAASAQNAFLASFGPDGKIGWGFAFDGNATDRNITDVAVSAAGRIALVGYFQTGAISVGEVRLSTPTPNAREGFVFVFDAGGKPSAARGFRASSAAVERPLSVAFDRDDNLLVAGDFVKEVLLVDETDTPLEGCAKQGDPGGATNAFVAKLDRTLHCAWIQGFGGGSNGKSATAYAVAAAPDGEVLVGGGFRGDLALPGLPILTNASVNEDAFVAALSPAGVFTWSKRFGGPVADRVRDLVVDDTGVYLTGFFERGPLTLDGCKEPIVSNNGRNVIAAKLDRATGACLWERSLGGDQPDEGHAVALTPDAVAVAGYFTTDIALGAAGTTRSAGEEDGFVAWLDRRTGAVQTGVALGSSGSDAVESIAPDGTALYVAGAYNAAFDALPAPHRPDDFFLGDLPAPRR